jgi:hypothetical protein
VSIAVALEALWERVAEFGPRAYLVTVGSDGHAHVVSAAPRREGAGVAVDAGNTSRSNVAANPAVTILWPPPGDGDYSLIVDGTAAARPGEPLLVQPTRAVLHRVAGAAGPGPGCVPVLDASTPPAPAS